MPPTVARMFAFCAANPSPVGDPLVFQLRELPKLLEHVSAQGGCSRRWSRRRLRVLILGILLLRVRGRILLGPRVGLTTRNAISNTVPRTADPCPQRTSTYETSIALFP